MSETFAQILFSGAFCAAAAGLASLIVSVCFPKGPIRYYALLFAIILLALSFAYFAYFATHLAG